METYFAAAMLLHPVALTVLAFVVFSSIYLGALYGHSRAGISWQRLFGGLVGAFVASLLLAAAASYASLEEAKRFGVGPEHYASALWHEFVIIAVILAYASLFGCAIIGVPVTLALATRGFATAPVVIAASVLISLAFFGVMLLS